MLQLFDIIFSDSIATMTGLRDLLSLTTELLKAKDKELAQYRAEGFALRRSKCRRKGAFSSEEFLHKRLYFSFLIVFCVTNSHIHMLKYFVNHLHEHNFGHFLHKMVAAALPYCFSGSS